MPSRYEKPNEHRKAGHPPGYAAWGLSFGYDRYGNRTAQAVTVGSAPSNSLGVSASTNQITNTGFTYDANGNNTNDGVNTLVYDAESHLASINSSAATYTYDGNGLRVQKSASGTTTAYIFSGGKVIAEYDNGAAVGSPSREFIYSGGTLLATIDSTGTKYHHADHLSPRVTTDASGNVIGQQGHFPFGESWYAANTTTKYQFTSYERDSESGNDYAQARYHINRLGRFSSPDQIGGHLDDPQSLNRYSYVRNTPINSVDPTGMITGCPNVANIRISHGDNRGSDDFGPYADDSDDASFGEPSSTCAAFGNSFGGSGTVNLDGVDISRSLAQMLTSMDSTDSYSCPTQHCILAYDPKGDPQISALTVKTTTSFARPVDANQNPIGDWYELVTYVDVVGWSPAHRCGDFYCDDAGGHIGLNASSVTEDPILEWFIASGVGGALRGAASVVLQPGEDVGANTALTSAKPVGSALREDAFHRAASWMRQEAAQNGTRFTITGADGNAVTLTQIPGELNGIAGRFEYIVNQAGELTHQMFVAGGRINGIPKKP